MHIFIYKSMPILLCVSKYYTNKRAPFRVFLYIHIHTLISLMKMMWTYTQSVRFVHRMIWSIIHYSSTFVYKGTHWKKRRLSFFIASMISIAHMFRVHTCIHAIRPSFNVLTIGHMSLSSNYIGRRSSTHFRSLMFLLSTITFFPFLILTLSLIMHSTTKS
jgi:hypothetical protein